MQDAHSNVDLSTAYTVFFWLIHVIICLFILLVGYDETVGAWLLVFIVTLLHTWQKKAVLNRSKIFYEKGANTITVQTGRYFVRDEDIIPIKAIDNIKMDRSLPGKIFGFCTLKLMTRGNEVYKMRGPSTKQAEKFRDAISKLM